jgi:putative NADPH-quinone reductase
MSSRGLDNAYGPRDVRYVWYAGCGVIVRGWLDNVLANGTGVSRMGKQDQGITTAENKSRA